MAEVTSWELKVVCGGDEGLVGRVAPLSLSPPHLLACPLRYQQASTLLLVLHQGTCSLLLLPSFSSSPIFFWTYYSNTLSQLYSVLMR